MYPQNKGRIETVLMYSHRYQVIDKGLVSCFAVGIFPKGFSWSAFPRKPTFAAP